MRVAARMLQITARFLELGMHPRWVTFEINRIVGITLAAKGFKKSNFLSISYALHIFGISVH